MTILENGKTYAIVNEHKVSTIIFVRRGHVYALNGAPCGTVKSFTSHPKYHTLTITEIKPVKG